MHNDSNASTIYERNFYYENFLVDFSKKDFWRILRMQQITNLEYSKRNIITKKIETSSPKQMACKGLMVSFKYY